MRGEFGLEFGTEFGTEFGLLLSLLLSVLLTLLAIRERGVIPNDEPSKQSTATDEMR